MKPVDMALDLALIVMQNGGSTNMVDRTFQNVLKGCKKGEASAVWRMDFVVVSNPSEGEMSTIIRPIGAIRVNLLRASEATVLGERVARGEVDIVAMDSDVELIAEPGRFIVATAAMLVSEIIGKARRDGKIFYHINDGVYHTFSGIVYDHWQPNFTAFKRGKTEVCAVVGPTCDSFDKISLSENLPANLQIGDMFYTVNIGAYSTASTTKFNGFDGAKILHINN